MTLLDTFYIWPLYFVVAALGGAINSFAGGGTFLIFPTLIFGSLNPLAANVTATVAVWPGTITSAYAYRGELAAHKHRLLPFAVISLIGGALGSAILLLTPEKTFEFLVPWLMLAATLVFTFGRYIIPHLHRIPGVGPRGRVIVGLVLQLCIATYGGYFGAGMGILMLAMLQLIGIDRIHQMNAFKTTLGMIINSISVAIFVVSGKIYWPAAIVMFIGASIGGFFGARTALKIPPTIIRIFVSLVGFSMTAYFFTYGV